MTSSPTTILLDHLSFPEGPRWHEGRLWFSDMNGGAIHAVGPTGDDETVLEVAHPSGMGWLPDGNLLLVSMREQKLLKFDGNTLREAADLSDLADWWCNDMVVDSEGRAYVGNFGFDLFAGGPPTPTCLILVPPDSAPRVVATDLLFPNGMVITPDGSTLIVAETFASQLTAFDVQKDGSLENRRVFAQIEGTFPDGICLDAAGAVWIANAASNTLLRVQEGGEVTDSIEVQAKGAYACMLGGEDGKTLFACTASSSVPEETTQQQAGAIETVRVETPHAGLP